MAEPREVRPGVWKVTLYAGKDAQGRQRQTSKTFRTSGVKAARKVARDFEDARDEARRRSTVRGETMNGLIDSWLATRDRLDSPNTVYRRTSIVAAIRRGLGDLRPDQLTPEDIDRFYNRLRDENVSQAKHRGKTKRRSESTIHHYHRVLTAILTFGWKRNKVAVIETKRATAPKARKIGAAVKPPSPDDVRRLVDAAPLGLAAAVHFAAATGVRAGEEMALRWSDFDPKAWTVRIARSIVHIPGTDPVEKSTKTEDERDIDLDPDTIAILDAHYLRMKAASGDELAPDAFVFANIEADPTGQRPHKPSWLSGQWRRLRAKHGVTCRFHDLRHFHATQLLAAGIDLAAVSQRLGHSLTSTTSNIYTHALEESGRAAAVAIRGVLAAPPLSEA